MLIYITTFFWNNLQYSVMFEICKNMHISIRMMLNKIDVFKSDS